MRKSLAAVAPKSPKDFALRVFKAFVAAALSGTTVASFTSIDQIQAMLFAGATAAYSLVLNAILGWANSTTTDTDQGDPATQNRRAGHMMILAALLVGLVTGQLFAYFKNTQTTYVVPEDGVLSDFKIVAMGDSYISGEGSKVFFLGSDDDDNGCRRSPTAFPYLIKQLMGAELVFAACSGAKTIEILDEAQYPDSPAGQFGGEPQIEVLKQHPDADVVLLTIGGNDAKFGDLKSCALRNCTKKQPGWMANLEQVRSLLERTYIEVNEATEAAVFVLTYPDPLDDAFCGDVPGFSESEYMFLKNRFIPALNQVVRESAAKAEVEVIDLQDSFEGRRICQVSPGDGAMNILGIGRRPGGSPLNWGHNSFHPNAVGHTRFAAIVAPVVASVWIEELRGKAEKAAEES